MQQVTKKPQIPILFFFFSLAIVLGVLYTAALPSLIQYFQVSKAMGQATISLFLVGCLLGQVVYAPVANAIGRKPAIYIGCGLSLLGCGLCILAIEMGVFWLLLVGRVLTAFGASCGLVLTNTLVADSFTVAESKKKLSLLMTAFGVFPVISVLLGGFITEYASWQNCFYVMLLYAVFVTGLCIFLPETGQEKHIHHLHITRIARSYGKQLRNLTAMLYTLLVAAGAITLYVFYAEAPFIAISELHISPEHFALYNIIPGLGMLLGGITAARISHRVASKKVLIVAGILFSLLSALMWLFFASGVVNVFTLFGIPFVIFFATPAILSNGQALATAASENKAYASSTLYIMQYIWLFLGITLLTVLKGAKDACLPIVYTLSGIVVIILWIVLHYLPQKEH